MRNFLSNPEFAMFFKIAMSLVIGGIIGFERELRSKSAGFRTLILISMGSTIFTIASISLGGLSNPDRIAGSIVTGIGFIGAGVIFKGDNRINGITTAATIWVTAAIGMCIGVGLYGLAIGACGLVLLVHFLLTHLESKIDYANQVRTYTIVCDYENETLKRFEDLFVKYHLDAKNGRQIKREREITGIWIIQGSEKNHELCIQQIINDPTVRAYEY